MCTFHVVLTGRGGRSMQLCWHVCFVLYHQEAGGHRVSLPPHLGMTFASR